MCSPDFHFEFTGTAQDLLDAERALLRERTGMRPFYRWCVLAMGFAWVGSAAASALGVFETEPRWLPIVWLVIGSAVLYWLLVKPLSVRHEIRQNQPESVPVAIDFTRDSIAITINESESFTRPWIEVAGVVQAEPGILLIFGDGVVNILPNRVFDDPVQRAELIQFAMKQTSEAEATWMAEDFDAE